MSVLGAFIDDLCDEMEILEPDWEHCPTCGYVIPFLRKDRGADAITPTKLKIRSLMRIMKQFSPKKYKIFNDRFRSMPV